MNTIEVQLVNLTKKFDEVVAVEDLSLDVYRGEFLSLLGPSGCGKTTTLRIIAGLTVETAGMVFIRGENVSDIPVYKRNIGMVFQDYALFPHMTVRDNVAFGLRMRGVRRDQGYARAEEMLELVRLPGIGDRRPNQLSGGQQQRVALARALAPQPTVLLLDEPLSNLDLKLRQEMRVELKRIQKDIGITTIFVTHDQGEALSLSDRIAVMQKGRIVQISSPVDLYENPNSDYVASFLGDSNFFRGKVQNGRLWADGIEIVFPGLQEYEEKEVIAVVRAERISLSPEPMQGPNTLIGNIDTSIYLGSVTRYYIQSSAGEQIIVDAVQPGHNQFPDGSRVTVSWREADCILIKEKI